VVRNGGDEGHVPMPRQTSSLLQKEGGGISEGKKVQDNRIDDTPVFFSMKRESGEKPDCRAVWRGGDGKLKDSKNS